MFFFLISCFSFILLSNSFSVKPLSSRMSEWRFLSPCFWGQLSGFLVSWFNKRKLSVSFFQLHVPLVMPLKKMTLAFPKPQNVEEEDNLSLLDLPDLTLECILERLSPAGLCSMAGVCSSLRDRCRSDHFWEKHMKQKWGRVIGEAAHREWQWYVGTRRKPRLLDRSKPKGLFRSLCQALPIPGNGSRNGEERSCCMPLDSIMACYLSLENGKFWFPAQVFNRENGHVGFMLSCYDAKLCYDSQTDTFQARYLPQGRLTTEENIGWDRLRAPPVDTPSNVLHVSDCLNDMKPGDHIEIQWRRNKDFPYGWWYGVVGHLESCDGNEHHCHCHWSDTIVLEFHQYTQGSRWRRTMVNRKDHREEGDEADGFYGGIRKLYKEEEISTWRKLWPKQVLE